MSDFSVNFGNAKTLPDLPEAGSYELVVQEYQIKPRKDGDAAKGFNISLTLGFASPEYSGLRVFHNLYVNLENPFAAKYFFEQLTGIPDLADTEVDLTDANQFIGERVGCALMQETYTNNSGQEKIKLTPINWDAWYSI